MKRPLEGIKIIEVSTWAFVPVAGAILSDMGADVIKIEPPTGDPMRELRTGATARQGRDSGWDVYNRGKRSITLDLRLEGAAEVLHKLVADADVFLTNLLPRARRKMKIDIADIRARNPKVIYAVGSGLGQQGPESEKGGFDAISFWARGGVASSITPDEADYPYAPPGPAFGDCTGGAMLAGGVAAAIAQRAMTGHVPVVDLSLLAAGMWVMQRTITQSTPDGPLKFPRPKRTAPSNPLVNVYRTSDGRFLSLCMLQGERYWPPFCATVGRPDLLQDPRFATPASRIGNIGACVAELDALFATKTLAEWRVILAKQEGQWDVVQHVGELKDDCQVQANGYIQPVEYEDGRVVNMVSVPVQFDGAPLPARPAPELGGDSDRVLSDLGYTEDEIIQLKVSGIVF